MITHECIITKASGLVWPASDSINIQAEKNEDETRWKSEIIIQSYIWCLAARSSCFLVYLP